MLAVDPENYFPLTVHAYALRILQKLGNMGHRWERLSHACAELGSPKTMIWDLHTVSGYYLGPPLNDSRCRATEFNGDAPSWDGQRF